MVSRPHLYTACLASLCRQTCQDFEHVVIVDEKPGGSGFTWVNHQWTAHQHEVHGQYVLQLDDDDVLAVPDAVEQLKMVADATGVDIVVFRTDHAELGILPDGAAWGIGPVHSHMGGEDYIVKRELWERHLSAWQSDRYSADYDFMAALWSDKPKVLWYDVLLIRCQRISRGRPE